VFRAYDSRRDRLVAVKVFRVDVTPEQSATLVRALRTLIARDITHPAIAAPIAAGLDAYAAYLATEYAVGASLDATAHNVRMPLEEVVPIITAVAGAIDRNREQGVRHGLLHPRDIIMSADGPRVTGFGIAEALSSIGIALPVRRPYAAPDGPSDVYSLAAIACELLSGRPMSPGGWDELSAENGRELRDAFAAALSNDPKARPSRAGEFAATLREAAGSPPARNVGEAGPQPELDTAVLGRFAEPGAATDAAMDAAADLRMDFVDPPVEHYVPEPPSAKLFQTEEAAAGKGRGLKLAAVLLVVAVSIGAWFTLKSRASRQAAADGAPARPPVTSTTVDLPAPPAVPPATPNPNGSTVPSGPLPAPELSRPASGAVPVPVRPAVERGRLLVRSTPADATVSINGETRGRTPLTVRDLPLGSYTIHVTRDGFAAEDRRLRLTAKSPSASLVIPLKQASPNRADERGSTGTILVQSRPAGAQVFVNDRLIGSTPLAIPELPAGPTAVRIEMDGYQPWVTTVGVKAGERVVVTASLDRR
jgi:serine/threonine protein kinase